VQEHTAPLVNASAEQAPTTVPPDAKAGPYPLALSWGRALGFSLHSLAPDVTEVRSEVAFKVSGLLGRRAGPRLPTLECPMQLSH
jgi:hypothetical protein